MKYLVETIAVSFSLLSVILLMKKSIHNWIIGIFGCFAYAVIFLNEKLYAEFFLQGIFILVSIRGYMEWKKNKAEIFIDDDILVDFIFNISIFSLFIASSIMFTLYTSNPLPIMDSLASTLSIGAMYLMLKKNRNCWLYWIAANIVYIYIFLSQDLLLSASLYIVFTYLAARGYKQWKTETDEKI